MHIVAQPEERADKRPLLSVKCAADLQPLHNTTYFEMPRARTESAPLSFQEASRQYHEETLSREEYLHQLFLHCVPRWHEQLSLAEELQLRNDDDIAYQVWSYHQLLTGVQGCSIVSCPALSMHCLPGIGPESLEAVFQAYFDTGTARAVKAELDNLTQKTSDQLRISLALLALRDRNLPVLRLCIAGRATLDCRYGHAFEDLANAVDKKKESALYDLIEGSTWRRGTPWRRPGSRDERGM